MTAARLDHVARRPVPAGVALMSVLLTALVVHADTARSIVMIWNSSQTFAHGYLILPISIWLIWRQRRELTSVPWRPFRPAWPLLLGCGFAWMLGDLGDVQVVRQYAFVAMFPLSVLAITGPDMTRRLAFPLTFLLLAVPFGEIFVAPLIEFTADFTVNALQLTGIPVLRTGTHFEIPSGSWSVVEACSGVRYLISSFTLGCLYAYLNYRTLARRLLFIALSIVVPIIANGLRAYLIVMIGHLSGNELATGVDHLIYGWVFFGVVMFLMFWIGSYWREDTNSAVSSMVRDAPTRMHAVSPAGVMVATAASMVAILIWPLYARYVEQSSHNPQVASLDGIKAQWQQSSPFTSWVPGYTVAQAQHRRFYRSDRHQVGLSVGFYRNQHPGSMLVSSSNRLVPEQDKQWRQVASAARNITIAGHNFVVKEAEIQGTGGPFLVWSWYWIDNRFLANDYAGKLLQAKQKLLMQGDDGAAIALFAPYTSHPDDARAAMQAFLDAHLGPLAATLADASRKQRRQ